MRFLAVLLFFVIIACQDSNKSSQQQVPRQKIKTTAPIDRFNNFINQFPTAKLPYTLSAVNTFPRLDDISIQQILGTINDPELGLEKSIYCIATFKANDFIAVLYKWTQRPIEEDAPTYFELAIYTPYGSKQNSLILGKTQQTEDFIADLDLVIHPNLTITTKHDIKWYTVNENKAIEPYQSFYTEGYQITNSGLIQKIKTAEIWEKIPQEFTAPFVSDYKKDPKSSPLLIEQQANKTILKEATTLKQQLIVAPIILPNLDSIYFVSSLDIAPSNTLQDSFYIHSKLALIQFSSSNLKVITNQLIPTSEWQDIYSTIQETCNCTPSPYVNKAGIVNLTMLETSTRNTVYATLNTNNEIAFQCYQQDLNLDSTAYRLSLKLN